MIASELKPVDEILGYLSRDQKVFIVACDGCSAGCQVSDEQHTAELVEQLEQNGKSVTGSARVEMTCNQGLTALMLMDKYITAEAGGKTDKLAGATVTVCHIGTSERGDLAPHTSRADILVSAVGVKPGLISGDMVKLGAIVIDVATIRVKDAETGKTKTYGDVHFETAKEKAAAITPVPGGVGVVTTAILLRNTVEAAKWQMS